MEGRMKGWFYSEWVFGNKERWRVSVKEKHFDP